MKLKRLAVAWLRENEWPRWLAIDPNFQPDYQHWLRRMENTFSELKSQGVNVVKADIGIDDFTAWSKAHGNGRVDTEARAEYAATIARRMDQH
jgi:hypothetical protein